MYLIFEIIEELPTTLFDLGTLKSYIDLLFDQLVNPLRESSAPATETVQTNRLEHNILT